MSSQAWKDANYDKSIKVSQEAIDELKSRGTKEANIAYYKQHGATAEQREAMNRFYGKNTISSNTIASSDAPNIREDRSSAPSPTRPNAREDDRLGRKPNLSLSNNVNFGNPTNYSGALTTPPTNVPGLVNRINPPGDRATNPSRTPNVFSGAGNVIGSLLRNTPGPIGGIASLFSKK